MGTTDREAPEQATDEGTVPHRLSQSWPPLLIALLASVALFANLGGPTLWADEGDTAVFARSILEYGVPRSWDGRTFTDSDRGARTNSSLVMVGTPWLPYYLTAASLGAFGASPWAARLPFALAGLATVALLYLLVQRTTGDRRAAVAAALLLVFSVQFLLYARSSRYYALSMLLALALIGAFLRLREHRLDPWLVLAAIALYHCHPLPAAASLGGLGLLTLAHPGFAEQRRGFWLRIPVILVFTLPWTLLSWSGVEENSSLLTDLAEALPRLGQFAAEASVAIPLVGWLVLLPLLWRRLTPGDRRWLALSGAVLGAHAVLTPLLLSTRQLYDLGLRYACPVLPLAAGITGVLVARASHGRPVAFVALLVLFGLTHLAGSSLLWSVFPGPPPAATGVSLHYPRDLTSRFLRTEWVGFALELRETERGTVSDLVHFLEKFAEPDDIVVTNYAWEPIYFHTGLRQGLKVLEDYPIHAAARRHGLPEYVFGAENARWLVWRLPWDGYQGYEIEALVADLEAAGRSLEPAADFRETLWENRPELHFHRFPRVGYVYPASMEHVYEGTLPQAAVLRVTDDAVHSAATWSIVAVDAESREVGVAGAACSRAVEITGGVVPGLGAVAAQGGPNARGRIDALGLLAKGATPHEVIETVANSGYDWLGRLDLYESRQYGIAALGFEDAAAAFTGAKLPGSKGDAQGRGVSVQGNRLATRAVVDATLAAFEAGAADCRSDLADDLMVALEAGAARGGDVRCPAPQTALSAFITLARPDDSRRNVRLRLVVPAQKRGGADAVALLRQKFDAWRQRHPAQRRCDGD